MHTARLIIDILAVRANARGYPYCRYYPDGSNVLSFSRVSSVSSTSASTATIIFIATYDFGSDRNLHVPNRATPTDNNTVARDEHLLISNLHTLCISGLQIIEERQYDLDSFLAFCRSAFAGIESLRGLDLPHLRRLQFVSDIPAPNIGIFMSHVRLPLQAQIGLRWNQEPEEDPDPDPDVLAWGLP
ncbi:hypothetical protein C8Q74DRAFT_1373348 [Fomes fomentarius]|nr:hypothetical protein C8Q74DRAFT_1373348 [Fomes fomentarius]